ncbi:D-alanyl-D-alanine carboxypeptidase [Tissierella pigra]|uniref:D-alanyl-D-alanine carboxypeptidase n=1 Tax=Tissierella pigra TaxID=2607614 RepID=A0A6N7XMH7_9FIRM|nr:D-alanyl-D-alanine carboxypeptidase [Tissierella pigra]MBU5426867.1 D-alanyl-D-alanine carboxypeptidase [Tissierella pigra]MSU03259.1 D-alanyl-D-alanine carboxypeptidase [Tissierella pigra]
MTVNRQRYKRKKRKIKYIFSMLCVGAVFVIALFLQDHIIGKNNQQIESPIKNQETRIYEESNQIIVDDLYSSNAILISLDDNEILLDKSSDERIYPASLTKIMTAIVAIENLPDLDEEIYLSEDMFEKLYSENASMAGFLPNEKVPAIDLIYGVLLPSGAESCIGLADAIAGSEKSYVKLMNEKAEELEMNDTHFINSTGLHHRNHYTTVNDIAKLLKYALQNNIFREVYTSKRYTTKATNLHSDGITFQSTMFKKMDTEDINNGTIKGGKTGYTGEAKLCLASLAKIDGKEYILVTANADGSPYTEQFNILDAFTVYNQVSKTNDY